MISIFNGHVIRNEMREPDAYIEPCGNDASVCSFPEPIMIPPGEHFVLGDNRCQSADSRFWGPIKRSGIIGLLEPR